MVFLDFSDSPEVHSAVIPALLKSLKEEQHTPADESTEPAYGALLAVAFHHYRCLEPYMNSIAAETTSAIQSGRQEVCHLMSCFDGHVLVHVIICSNLKTTRTNGTLMIMITNFVMQ